MERAKKIPHSTCKHARVRLFYPPILTRQDFARRSRKQDQCVAKVGADRRDAPRFRRVCAKTGAAMPLKWVVSARPSLPVFIPEQIVPYKRTVTGALFLPTYPDESGLIAPIGKSGYEVAEE